MAIQTPLLPPASQILDLEDLAEHKEYVMSISPCTKMLMCL